MYGGAPPGALTQITSKGLVDLLLMLKNLH